MSDKLEKNSILLKNPWLSDVKIVAESESTQKDAKLDNQENCLYMTERQLATYGRFGRQYFAAEDGGIYMSLMLHPSVSTDRLPNYTLLTGAAVVSAIEKLTDKRPQIKWVNDIYLGEKKFVGILAEASVNADKIPQIIIGVGINFSIHDFPEELSEKATSLFANEQPTVTRSELVAEIWSEFHRLSNGDFFDIYKAHSFILGKQVEFSQSGEDYIGIATDLTASGELIVDLFNGQQKVLSSGEISLKKWT
ncbi:MAG: biotin--[acetyl-CoA-carboxylase] ligase [Streptococcaceae bacterium]|nr:biotin--[acetyl-CoA-carboxylase] ligase [Streptococcaceae bacterium]